jgi:menaquinol-cytochrome c reductase iron-sulfur subunit
MNESRKEKPEVERPADFDPSRRGVLRFLAGLFNAAAAVLVAVPIIGYFFAPMAKLKGEDSWISLGPADGFPVGGTRVAEYKNPNAVPWDGPTDRVACYVRRTSKDTFKVLAINCTHLGCPVEWFAESGLFLCPCHGGVYYSDGAHAAGPPPRGLYEYDHRIVDGRLEVRGGHLPTLQNTFKKPV